MSFFSTVKSWWSRQWSWVGQTTPTKKQEPVVEHFTSIEITPPYSIDPRYSIHPKETSMPVSPASVSTGSALPNTTATFYGAKKPVKKSKKPQPKPKAKKK